MIVNPLRTLAKPLLAALLVLVAGPVRAGLKFDSDTLRDVAKPEMDTHEAKFHFTVTGDKPVEISKVETLCGCISATADKAFYKPGEEGVITAVFKLGAFEGEVSKSIIVHSNDKEAPERQLTLAVTIPKLFAISPEVTSWTVGDPPNPKTVTFKVLYEKPVEVLNLATTRDNFTVELKEVKKGAEYQFVLTPKSTADPILGALRIETSCEIPRYKSRLCFFNVVRPSSLVTPLPPRTPAPPPTVSAPVPAPPAPAPLPSAKK